MGWGVTKEQEEQIKKRRISESNPSAFVDEKSRERLKKRESEPKGSQTRNQKPPQEDGDDQSRGGWDHKAMR